MFKQEQVDEKEVETIIGPSVKVKGNFQTKGSVQIDGQLEGTLKIEENLIVGENAKIIAFAPKSNGFSRIRPSKTGPGTL